MDERYGTIGYQTAHYQGVEFSPTVVLDGKVHWSPRYTTHGNKGWEVIDLYSGETIYKDYNATRPNMGQIYNYESPNQHGGFAYLWETGAAAGFFGAATPVPVPEIITVSQAYQKPTLGLPVRTGTFKTLNRTATPVSLGTVWKMVDAYTFKTICYVANVSTSGTQVYCKDGSIVYYNPVNYGTTANPNYKVVVWNSSGGTMVASESGTGSWQWRPAGGDFGAENPYFGVTFGQTFNMDYNIVHDGRMMYSQNFSIPSLLGPRNAILNETASVRAIRQDEYMIVGTQGVNDYRGVVEGFMMGISLKQANIGAQLWKTTFTPPFIDASKNITAAAMFTGGFSLTGVYPEYGVFTFGEVRQLKAWVFDLGSGKQLWTTDDTVPQYNYYGQSQAAIEGKLLIYGGYSGTMKAYNITTGEKLWTYNAENVGQESAYGNYPMQISAVSDGKIYTTSWEHSYTQPIIRGPNLRCINATDGKEIWSILSFGCNTVAISDGILVAGNSVDNMIYGYGMGPSATTVSAPQTAPALGSSVTLTGTVTDQSPSGRRNTNDKIDFVLKGTPAISDADMTAWMEYKFMQQAYPENAKGVEVTLDAIDPNNNYIHIGTTTSDVNGNYGLEFTPEVPGTYQIIATFAGSKSYGSSFGSTYMTVGEEALTPAGPEYPQPIDNTLTIVGVGIAMIIAVAIATLLILRKRP
jgi:outer membrane protein assembly factor BamB